jgi:type IV pilus assembly protein PilE
MRRQFSPFRRRGHGFTLIELLVSVAIVGILAAIAYPAYTKYVVKGNRGAAQAYLLNLSQAEVEYFADARSYASDVTTLNQPTPANVSAKYTIQIDVTAGPPATFTVSAIPIVGGQQDGDGTLTIDNTGAKTPSDKW